MKFETVVLERCEQRLILRCTLHGSRPGAYQELQKQMNSLAGEYNILIEGVYGPKIMPDGSSEQEYRIAAFLARMFTFLPRAVGKNGFVHQRQALKYPDSVTAADLSFVECVQWLYEQGLRLPWWVMPIIENTLTQKLITKITQQMVTSMNSGQSKTDYWKLLPYYPLAFLLMLPIRRWRKYSEMLHEHRNKVLVNKVEELCLKNPQAKLLVHYGKKHRDGIVNLLCEKGWAVCVLES